MMTVTVEEFTRIIKELEARLAVAEARATAAEARATAAEARATAAEARAAAAEARCAKLEKENAELRARLGKNSQNSDKPPSSDPPFKRRPPEKKGMRKPGGQPGHPGKTRPWVPEEKVTKRVVVRPDRCTCGNSLEGVRAGTGTTARQVVETPKLVPDVTEYVFEAVQCPCCSRVNRPEIPPQAATATGPNLTALAATLVGQYHLSRDAAADLLTKVLGVPICAATVQAATRQVSEALAETTREVQGALQTQEVLHIDETSWRQGRVLHWLWGAIGATVTAFSIHRRRGKDQLKEWFPEGFDGVVNSDRWRAYEMFERRQLCWSHLQRDLQSIIDAGGVGATPAQTALDGAGGMFSTWHRFKRKELSREELQRETSSYREEFQAFCRQGEDQEEDRKWRSLGRDLLRQWGAVFLFLDVEGVEPTNNTVEQGLRGAVIWRRISQGTRTEAGSRFVQRILTASANCVRQGRDLLGFLAEALLAHRAGLPPPSLLPPV
jgi:transposase